MGASYPNFIDLGIDFRERLIICEIEEVSTFEVGQGPLSGKNFTGRRHAQFKGAKNYEKGHPRDAFFARAHRAGTDRPSEQSDPGPAWGSYQAMGQVQDLTIRVPDQSSG